jgi:hypothetical protein
LIAFQRGLDLVEHGPFRLLRIALEPVLNEFEVPQDHLQAAGIRRGDGVGRHDLLFTSDVHLDIGLLFRLDQFADLVEPGVLDVVFSDRDAGDAE